MKLRLPLTAWLSLGILLSLLLPVIPVSAQEESPRGPVYIVQQGDTLWDIAFRFGVSMTELQAENGISDASLLKAGDELVIPGLEGVTGVLTTTQVEFGESVRSLSRRYQIPANLLMKLNRLASPAALYRGARLIIPEATETSQGARRGSLQPGQSWLELAVSQNANPWALAQRNNLGSSWASLPGDVLALPGGEAESIFLSLPAEISTLEVYPSEFKQGGTVVIRLEGPEGLSLAGEFMGRELNFFRDGKGYSAMQGIHAMSKTGVYPLVLRGEDTQGRKFGFSQLVPVLDGGYGYDPTLPVDPKTVDPANTKPEDELWNSLPLAASPEKLWEGFFNIPVSPLFADCYPSYFGSRRSYNDGPYNYFHTGLDYCGGVGAEIFAPADGIVVYTGSLTVRGNATLIDHGWGVYSAYEHQSEILVEVGERVKTGQLIGKIGGTGRVTGAHLHWEIWVGGVQVDPLDWLANEYP